MSRTQSKEGSFALFDALAVFTVQTPRTSTQAFCAVVHLVVVLGRPGVSPGGSSGGSGIKRRRGGEGAFDALSVCTVQTPGTSTQAFCAVVDIVVILGGSGGF